jgi:ribonucleotide reductase beta subunit family protein with ferritin-like domain
MRIHHHTQPMIEYHKAKDLFWDPRQIEFGGDRRDWEKLDERERDIVLRMPAVSLPIAWRSSGVRGLYDHR